MSFDPTTATPEGVFDPTSAAPDTAPPLRTVLEAAVRENPDQAAQIARLTNRFMIPRGVVERNLPQVQQREAADRAEEQLQLAPKLAAYMRENASGTGQYHDEVPVFKDIERTFTGTLRDVAVTGLKGAVGLPQAVVGLASMVTGGYAGKGAKAIGIDFNAAQKILESAYSPAQQQANSAVQEADGFVNTAVEMLANPSTIATAIGESLPQMLGGAGIGRGILAAAPKVVPWLAAALGEGVIAAGSAAEQTRESTADGLLTAKQSAAAALSGAGTALFGAVGGKVSQRLGLADIDTALVKSGVDEASAKLVKTGFIRSMANAGISEGLFEEMPQSVQEQIWQNWATDKPLNQGVGKVAAAGLLTGAVTGSVFQGATTAANRATQTAQAEQSADNLQQQLALATQAQLRERNPDEFRALVGAMSEDAEIHIDAGVFNQLAPEVLAQLPQSVQDQLANQVTDDTLITVPTADVLTIAPGTPLEQFFTENARLNGPNSMSQAEAKDAGAKAQEFLAQESARVIQQAVDQQAMQESSDRVRQGVLDQLNAVGRFRKDVNEGYATWTAAFYTTMAGRLGITPEQMQAQYPLRITGQASAGETLKAGKVGELTVEGYHYSAADRSSVYTGMYGTGLQGSGREQFQNAKDQRLAKRAYFYADKGTGINPEAGVGGRAHKANLSNVYDANTDPLRLRGGSQEDFESKVLDAGFSGYLDRLDGTQSAQVIMLGDQNIPVEQLGALGKTNGQVVAPVGTREAKGRDVIVDALNANKSLPMGQTSPQMWGKMLARMMPEAHAAMDAAGVFNGTEPLYKSELVKAFQNATPAESYAQSATLRSGEETLAKYGLPLGGKYNTRDIAAALEARQREKWGKIDPTDRSPEALAKIADWMAEEVRFEIQHPRKSGVGWYSYKFQRALDNFAEVFPELKKDKDARATLTALIAITSDGQKVLPNFRMAVDLYSNFRKTGKFSTDRGHARMDSIQGNVDLLQKMLDDMGPKAMRKYLLQEATVSELRKRAKAEGVEFKTDYQAHIKLPMAAVTFGPKLGAFYANLMGSHGYLTMDRWWSRTFNRYRGTLLQAPTKDGLLRIKELMGHPEWSDDQAISATVEPRKSYEAKNFKNGTEIEKAANTVYKAAFENLEDAPFNATDRTFMLDAVAKAQQVLEAEGRKISVADIQAVLWYYEKRLYGELGARQTADVSYEDAAKKVVAEQANTGSAGGPDAQSPGGSAGENDTGAAAGVSEETVAPGLEPFDTGDLNGQYEQAGDRGGRDASGSLAPLAGAPDIRGAAGPDPRLVAVAERYARDNGIPLRRQAEYVQVDEARAARIAQAYADMQHAPNDPQVKEAYADLIRQTRAQYDALVAAGYEFTFFDDAGDPYQGNPWNAMRDLRANQHMAVYGTYAGFGVGADLNIGLADPNGGANLDPTAVLAAIRNVGGDVIGSVIHSSATEPTLVIKLKNKLDDAAANGLSTTLGQEAIAQSFEDGTGQLYGPQAANWGDYNPEFFVTADGRRASETLNPLLADTGLQWPDQSGTMHPVRANDLFRAVHDAFGHGLEGAGFRAQGEENAWQAHVRLFTGPAVGAITSETRGQNSWLNYGAYGERNQTAKVEDTVFAEQKTGLMPEWTWNEGRAGDMAEQGVFNQEGVSQTDTPEFQAWSGNAPLVALGEKHEFKSGQPVVVEALHGTTNASLTEFSREKANVESDFGAGFYASNSPEDVAANYANESGPDLTNRVERLAEQIEQDDEFEGDHGEAVRMARAQLSESAPNTLKLFVRFNNPIVIGGKNETELDYTEEYDEETGEYGEPTGKLVEFVEAVREIAPDFNVSSREIEATLARIFEESEGEGLKASSAARIIKNDLVDAEDDTGGSAASEVVRLAFEAIGFDGVIDTSVAKKFKNMDGLTVDSVHFIAFQPTQLKSAIGNQGTFNPNDPNILRQGPRGTFNPKSLELALNENADLSTFLHETGHFFLEVMADLASQPNAPADIASDMAALTKWFGVADLATWNAMTLDQKRPYHERFAESMEQYLMEGKAPSLELQPLFRKFRAWMLNVYKSLKAFIDGRPDANIQLSDEVRQVFDRMLASEEQIAQAEEVAGLLPNEDATTEAIEKLTARSLRDLKWTVNARAKAIKALQKQAATLRKEVEAEVTAEVNQMPEFQAKDMLDKTRKENKQQLNDTELAIIADAFQYPDVQSMLQAIDAAGKKSDVIEGMTDQRMLERHGDLIDQRAIEQAANEAVHNEARARSLATELRSQAEALNPRTDTGEINAKGSKITVNAIVEAAKQFAANVVSKTPLKDLKAKAWQHTAAERRAGKRWQEHTAKGETAEAIKAKQDQVLNNAAAKAALDAQLEMRKILTFFKRVIKDGNEKTVEKGRDPDVVNAARAVLGAYGIAPKGAKTAAEYMDLVAKNDPAMYAALQPSIQGALNMAQPLDALTMDELRGLHEEIQSMWHLAKRSRQMEVDGNLMDMEDAEAELQTRMQAIGVPSTMPGDTGAMTPREELARKLQHAASLLRRAEQWAQGMGNEFTRLVFRPVKDAADAYRADRVQYRKKYQALVDNVAPALTKGLIAAPELNYTFGEGHNGIGHAELLHAILHTGNASNKRKLLLGRGWAIENADGTLNTDRWDAFLTRMHDTGVLNKAHYDFAQGVWDLLEQTKPLAQKTHRDVFGRYFAEVTADSFETPFGSYRGGYVPAQADPRIVQDADLRKLAEAENENMAFSFPGTNKGFTKGRVDYNRPLMLDLRTIGQHIDKVLLFSHMEPAVRDVQKLLSRKGVSYSLGRIDPTIYAGMLTPWLNRSARQIVETPIVGDGGISRMLSAARSRAGMSLMFANISNTLQQLTGFSLAAVKVKPASMMAATAQFIASPKKTAKAVSDASEFMANRMENEISAINDAMDEILLDPNLYAKAQNWTRKHAYFMQTAMANTMEPIIWTAAYNDALAEGQSERDAVRAADSVIRTTQGSTLPEDVSRIETGPAYARIFTQFIGYFNMMANTNATALKQISQEIGLKKGAGKALGVVTLGLLIPIWVAEAIAQAMRGGPDDPDKDGYLDDWLAAVFGMGTIKGAFAMVPFIGQLANAGINRFNGNPADDKMSLSPAVSLLESAAGVPVDIYKAITGDVNKRNMVRDVASAVSIATGLPAVALARPLGYLAGVADDKIDPTSTVDAVRGALTGSASPASK